MIYSKYKEEILFQTDAVVAKCIVSAGESAIKKTNDEFVRTLAVRPRQTHSTNVAVAESHDDIFEETDALITFKKNLPIGVLTADCVPIVLYCPDIRGIAAIHSGWKGTTGGIVDNVVKLLIEHNADPCRMIVVFGPSISSKLYEVDQDFADKFAEAGWGDFVSYPNGVDGKPHVDLQGINRARMLRLGIVNENIHIHNGCTYSSVDCDGQPVYESHRRSGGAPWRNLTMIELL